MIMVVIFLYKFIILCLVILIPEITSLSFFIIDGILCCKEISFIFIFFLLEKSKRKRELFHQRIKVIWDEFVLL